MAARLPDLRERTFAKGQAEAEMRAAVAGIVTVVGSAEAKEAVAFHLQGDPEMYSEANLLKRHALKRDPDVVGAVARWRELVGAESLDAFAPLAVGRLPCAPSFP